MVGKVWSTLERIGILSLKLNWITKGLSNLVCAMKFENCERDGLDLLHMIHITHWWWWNFKIKRIAKIAKWEIVEIVKKSQLCLSIVLNLGGICNGGLYKSCSP